MKDLAEIYGGPVSFAPSIFAAIEHGLLKNPDQLAAIVRHQPKDHLAELLDSRSSGDDHDGASKYLTWTYAQLHQAAAGLATGLRQSGVAPGSIVATLISNGIEYLMLLWAASLGRFGLACLDPGSLSAARSAELEYYIAMVQPAAIFLPDPNSIPAIDIILDSQKANQVLKVTLESLVTASSKSMDFVDICRASEEVDVRALSQSAKDDDPDRTSFILFTSGTSSGKPKGVPRDVRAMVFSIEGQQWSLPGIEAGRRLLTTANFRAIAPILSLRAWRDGATVVVSGKSFSPTAVLDAIEEDRVTDAILIPAMIHAMVAQASFASRDLSSLRLILSGGDIVTIALAEKSRRHFPSAGFFAGHGMTEGSALTQWTYWDGHNPVKYFGEIISLGGVTRGSRLRIVKDGQTVQRGETGELHCMNDSLLKQYLGGTNADSFYTDEYGQWFKTGDVALIDEDGEVFILGRVKDIIKRAGLSITPAAIESTLTAFANAQTAVLPVPHPMLGQEPFAILESFNGKTEKQLKDRVVEMFGKDYTLAGVVELKTLGLSEMPLNATNKVQKLELQGPLEAYLRRKMETD